MIEKLKEHEVKDSRTGKVYATIGCDMYEIIEKINELVDRENWLDKTVEVLTKRLKDHEEWQSAVGEMVNVHEREIDQLQMSINPEKCNYDDERKWIGKLCKFRDCEECGWRYGILTDIIENEEYPYWMGDAEWAECQPVLEDEFKNVIYKRENNESSNNRNAELSEL